MRSEHAVADDYRLPTAAVPIRYELSVATDFGSRRFEGEVAIELELTEASSSITCNAAELDVTDAALRPARDGGGAGEPLPLAISLDAERQRVSFTAAGEIAPGRYVLECRFSGTLNERLRGYYRSVFKDSEGVEREIASTHFESTDARRAFPCFDEPALKAVFSVTLEIPDGLFAVSNAPEAEVTDLGGGRRRVRFADTMKMSTYLVAYAVGPFEATDPVLVESVPLSAVVPKGKLHLTTYALEVASHALAWYHRYFDIAYPGEKLDLVAIPDFAQGAMENLGCIMFREADLLCDPAESSVPELSRIAEVVEHEIAHMWFGDLVTMRWWNGIWLNEAFATYMSICCLDDFRPEWNRWVTFGTEKDLALNVDGLHSTRPIEFAVNAPDECEAMFDHLTYLKGGNVLRMVEQYIGTEVFREGVRRYLRAHAYANTETTDLWDAIESASGGEPVRAVLDSWIFQGGHPLLTARLEAGELTVTEQPFSYLPEDSASVERPSAIGSSWLVPVRIEDRPGPVTARILGPAPHGNEPLRFPQPERLPVVNAGGSGTYRLRYEGSLFDQVIANLAMLEPLERFNLVSDSWACTLAGIGGIGDFLALTRRLGGEEDPNVWGVVSRALGLTDFAAADVADEPLQAFVQQLAGAELERIGFEARAGDSPERQRSRSILIGLAGVLGRSEAVIAGARELWAREGGDVSAIDPSIAESVLSVVVSAGGREEFEAVREGYRHPSDPLSEDRHLSALVAVKDDPLVAELLEMTLSEVKAQDAHIVLFRMMRSRAAGARTWGFVKTHYQELHDRLPSHAMPMILGGVSYLVQVEGSGQPAWVDDVERFVKGRSFGGHQLSVDQALERQHINCRFVSTVRPQIAELLAKA